MDTTKNLTNLECKQKYFLFTINGFFGFLFDTKLRYKINLLTSLTLT